MALNPLAPVTDYESKLSRIFWFTSISAVIAIWILRENVESIELALEKIDLELGDGRSLPLPGGYLLPALAVGLMSRVFRLYDRISDLLGIRERFDVEVIITELAEGAGVDISNISDSELVRRRGQLMNKGFYQYTSSKHPYIDEHLIYQALDWWSWFWVVVEAATVFVVTGLILIACRVFPLGITVMFGTLTVAMLALPTILNQCRRYAIAQVRAILSDPSRAQEVRNILSRLTMHQSTDLAA